MLPEGEDLNEWIAVNSEFMNAIKIFIENIQSTNCHFKFANINDPCTEVKHLHHVK